MQALSKYTRTLRRRSGQGTGLKGRLVGCWKAYMPIQRNSYGRVIAGELPLAEREQQGSRLQEILLFPGSGSQVSRHEGRGLLNLSSEQEIDE